MDQLAFVGHVLFPKDHVDAIFEGLPAAYDNFLLFVSSRSDDYSIAKREYLIWLKRVVLRSTQKNLTELQLQSIWLFIINGARKKGIPILMVNILTFSIQEIFHFHRNNIQNQGQNFHGNNIQSQGQNCFTGNGSQVLILSLVVEAIDLNGRIIIIDPNVTYVESLDLWLSIVTIILILHSIVLELYREILRCKISIQEWLQI